MTSAVELMKPMIAQARAEGKWLHCHYQDLWFSPDQLEAEHAKGNFRWGPVNWALRDPQERIARARRTVAEAQAELSRIESETK